MRCYNSILPTDIYDVGVRELLTGMSRFVTLLIAVFDIHWPNVKYEKKKSISALVVQYDFHFKCNLEA